MDHYEEYTETKTLIGKDKTMNRRKFFNFLGMTGVAILPLPEIKTKNKAKYGKLYTVDEKQYCFYCGNEKEVFPFQMYVSENDGTVRMSFRCHNAHNHLEKGGLVKNILTDCYEDIV